MNICIITPRYPYKDNMEFVFVKKLVDEWAKTGHHCVVVTFFSLNTYLRKRISYKPIHYRNEIKQGVFVDVYSPRVLSFGHLKFCGASVNEWICANALEKLMKKINLKFNFFYCHFFNSALVTYRYAHNNNVPLFVATGESNLRDLGAFRKPYPSFHLDGFRSYMKGVVSVSTKNKDEASNGGLIDSDKCSVFPNGTDLTIFQPVDKTICRKKLGFPQNAFIISCVGYICERKGQNRLLEAVRTLGDKDVKLVFLGKAAKVDTFTLEGEEIVFKGSVENKEIPAYLCASDVFCLPTRAEGCCNAVIEALACGLPIVSSNLPFNWDVLDGTNSILVDPNNVEEIAEAIKKLKDNEKLRISLSNGSKKKAENLSIEGRANAIMNFIKERL